MASCATLASPCNSSGGVAALLVRVTAANEGLLPLPEVTGKALVNDRVVAKRSGELRVGKDDDEDEPRKIPCRWCKDNPTELLVDEAPLVFVRGLLFGLSCWLVVVAKVAPWTTVAVPAKGGCSAPAAGRLEMPCRSRRDCAKSSANMTNVLPWAKQKLGP